MYRETVLLLATVRSLLLSHLAVDDFKVHEREARKMLDEMA